MRAKKPTYQQRKILEQNKLDTTIWYVQKDTPEFMQVKHVKTGEEKTLMK